MNGSKLSTLVRTEPVRKELGGRRPSPKKHQKMKKSHTEETKSTRNAKKGRTTLKRSKWSEA